MHVIRFGTSSEHIDIAVPGSCMSQGWCQAQVEIAVKGFQGKIEPWVERADFESFAAELRVLYGSLQGNASFSPQEMQLTFSLKAATGGHIQLSGEAWSRATYENKLAFVMELDQTYLVAPLHELESMLSMAPSDA